MKNYSTLTLAVFYIASIPPFPHISFHKAIKSECKQSCVALYHDLFFLHYIHNCHFSRLQIFQSGDCTVRGIIILKVSALLPNPQP